MSDSEYTEVEAALNGRGFTRMVFDMQKMRDLMDMLGELKALDPKPGRAFERGPVESVVPDVFVRQGPGGWLIELDRKSVV